MPTLDHAHPDRRTPSATSTSPSSSTPSSRRSRTSGPSWPSRARSSSGSSRSRSPVRPASGRWASSATASRSAAATATPRAAGCSSPTTRSVKLVNDLITPMTLVASASRHVAARRPRQLPRLVGRASLADRRAARPHRRVDRVPRPRTARRSTSTARSRPTTRRGDGEVPRGGRVPPPLGMVRAVRDGGDQPGDGRGVRALHARTTGRSWWAETADGTQRAVRLQRFEEHSPTFAALLADDRFLRIGRLTGDDYEARTGGEALEKPIGVVKGISDLMWHKDCALGMHSYRCCGLTVGHLGHRCGRGLRASSRSCPARTGR